MSKLIAKLIMLGSLVALGAQGQTQSQTPPNFNDLGYYRVAAIVSGGHVGDIEKNTSIAINEAIEAARKGAVLAVFPELNLTKYTAEDLFLNTDFVERAKLGIKTFAQQTSRLNTTFVIGSPFLNFDGRLYNAAFVIRKGQILGVVPKIHLPNYGEFYEKRWFISGEGVDQMVDDPVLGKFRLSANQLFRINKLIIGVEICEDAWVPDPPNTQLALNGANLIVNLSGSNGSVGKPQFRRNLVGMTASRLNSAYLYVSSGPGESTKGLVFDGHAMISENGTMLAESERFKREGSIIMADIDVDHLASERLRNPSFGNSKPTKPASLSTITTEKPLLLNLNRKYSKTPFVPTNTSDLHDVSQEIISIMATGLAERLATSGLQRIVIGVSGGLDSTLSLLVAVEATKILGWESNRILGITMPGFGTTRGTKSAAKSLMKALSIEQREVSIKKAVQQHFKDIQQDPNTHDITYENSQARERTQILFDIANKVNGLVLGTGDLSELCLGWCTFNGDHMSSYNVNASVPKTLVKSLVQWVADFRSTESAKRVLNKILTTEISPELLPPDAQGKIKQTTESIIGPYRLHDFFIYHFLRNGFGPDKIFRIAAETFSDEYTPEEIHKWLEVFFKRFQISQFKRTVLPPGPQIGSVTVDPRGKLRLPDELLTPKSCTFVLSGLRALGIHL